MDFKNLSNYTNNLSILYIEDEETVRIQIESILKDIFLEAHSAQNGELALEMYNNYFHQNNRHYNLLLVDIGLPKMNGIDFSRQVLQINPHQQIVIISAYNEKDKLQELISLGITSFIPKPVNKKVFFEVIKNKARVIINDNISTIDSQRLNYNKDNKSNESLQNDYRDLKKEFELYKRTSNENIVFLTQKNKIIHDKNISDADEITKLSIEIKTLKETIIELEKVNS